MKELVDKISDLYLQVDDLKFRVGLDQKKEEITKLEQQMLEPNFWQNQELSRTVAQTAADLKNQIESWEGLATEAKLLLDLAKEDEADQSVNLTPEIDKKYYQLLRQFRQLQNQTVLNGKYDLKNAVVSIYAGAGGTEAQDWAEMLFRMYSRYIESRGWKINLVDQSRGSEAGIKSATFEVVGSYAYGYLKAEAGVHRLVRLSPFDADHARHTSFAMVEVTPELGQADLTVKDEDIKIETSTASGHGGQSVNTTYSAIRLTHLPTGIKVSCQNERSQLQNKETAFKILYGKLAKYFEAQKEEERLALRGELTEAAWGNQIRSYVLHPYKMVKDHRTDYEVSDPDRILNGDLGEFIEEYLKSQIKL